MAKGSIGHAFTVCIRTENQNQGSFYPFVLHKISVLIELPLGHLCSPHRLPKQKRRPSDPREGAFVSDDARRSHAPAIRARIAGF
jgi:hypothetical protein